MKTWQGRTWKCSCTNVLMLGCITTYRKKRNKGKKALAVPLSTWFQVLSENCLLNYFFGIEKQTEWSLQVLIRDMDWSLQVLIRDMHSVEIRHFYNLFLFRPVCCRAWVSNGGSVTSQGLLKILTLDRMTSGHREWTEAKKIWYLQNWSYLKWLFSREGTYR